MNIKLFLIAVLLFAALLYWVLPKTRLSKKFKMSTGLFYTINIIGIIFGTLGLIVSFVWPNLILEKHYFELILLPIVFVYLYTFMIMKIQRTNELYDEKQNQNMIQAAATTWAISIFAVFLLAPFSKDELLAGPVLFPIFLYFSLAIYSANTLYYFRKN